MTGMNTRFADILQEIRHWVLTKAPNTGSARVFSDMVLSCFNGAQYPFDLGALRILDARRRALAMELLKGFLREGETEELRALGLDVIRKTDRTIIAIEVWDEERGGWRPNGAETSEARARLLVESKFVRGERARAGDWVFAAPDLTRDVDADGVWWPPGTWSSDGKVLHLPRAEGAM